MVNGTAAERKDFRRLFTKTFGLNAAGLSDNFRDIYFDRLFKFTSSKDDPYTRFCLSSTKFREDVATKASRSLSHRSS
jgi:hypothetical protein